MWLRVTFSNVAKGKYWNGRKLRHALMMITWKRLKRWLYLHKSWNSLNVFFTAFFLGSANLKVYVCDSHFYVYNQLQKEKPWLWSKNPKQKNHAVWEGVKKYRVPKIERPSAHRTLWYGMHQCFCQGHALLRGCLWKWDSQLWWTANVLTPACTLNCRSSCYAGSVIHKVCTVTRVNDGWLRCRKSEYVLYSYQLLL